MPSEALRVTVFFVFHVFLRPLIQGVEEPVHVQRGYYSGPAFPGHNFSVPIHNRYLQLVCPLGWYCVGGEPRPCPAGRFGNQTGTLRTAPVLDCHDWVIALPILEHVR
jgi:hypothetical protein